MRILQPKGWPRPSGYSHGIRASGDVVWVAGQVGWDAEGRIVSARLADQVRQALRNVAAVLGEADARPEHVVHMTWYVTDLGEYRAGRKDIGKAYREVMGRHYPAMTLVGVAGLVEDGAKVEIEAIALVPAAR